MASAYDTWLEGNCGFDAREAAREERVTQLVSEYAADPEKIKEADEWMYGEQSTEFYNDMESALAELAAVPADKLSGSDALARVLRAADVIRAARFRRLRDMAEEADGEAYSDPRDFEEAA